MLSDAAGDLPDELHLDFRQQPGGKDFGARLTGDVQRLKVLTLTEPTKDQESWSADDLRIWVATPTIGEVLDAWVLQDPLDMTLTTKSLFAEASVRNPRGIHPTRRVIRSVTSKPPFDLPGTTHVGPGVVAFGTAGGASSATSLRGCGDPVPGAWNDGTVRYLTVHTPVNGGGSRQSRSTGPRLRPRLSRDRSMAGAQYTIESVPTVVGLGTSTREHRDDARRCRNNVRAGWKGGFVRFLTDSAAGERQPIVGIDLDGTLL